MSQLPSRSGEMNNPSSSVPTTSLTNGCSESFTREVQSSQPANSMATQNSSTSSVHPVREPSTVSKTASPPARLSTARQEVVVATGPSSSENPRLPAPTQALATEVATPSTALCYTSPTPSTAPASSPSPGPSSQNKSRVPQLPSASSKTSTNVVPPPTGLLGALSNGSSSIKAPTFGSKPTGTYPFGPSIFATGTPTSSAPKRQTITFGQPSVPVPASSVTVTNPPVFGPLSSLASSNSGSHAQKESTGTSSRSRAPSASASTPSASAAPASFLVNNAPLTTPLQASTSPGTAASQPATSSSNARLNTTTTFPWPSPSTTKVFAASKTAPTVDCAASALVKQLQVQIQPLKHKMLLEGLLSHVTLADTDALGGDSRCHVCLETFLTGASPELPIKLPCAHICGSVCVLKWLAPQQNQPREKGCPICRKPIFGVECASEWNALTSLEKSMQGIPGKLQAMVIAPDNSSNNSRSPGIGNTQSSEAELPAAWGKGEIPADWGKGRWFQDNCEHAELQWKAWTKFLEHLVRYVESADEWTLWYFRREFIVPIVNSITISTFIDMRKKGSTWVSRVREEVPELYLPLHSMLDRDHPDYYLATPGEEQYRKTADLHARIEARGRRL